MPECVVAANDDAKEPRAVPSLFLYIHPDFALTSVFWGEPREITATATLSTRCDPSNIDPAVQCDKRHAFLVTNTLGEGDLVLCVFGKNRFILIINTIAREPILLMWLLLLACAPPKNKHQR